MSRGRSKPCYACGLPLADTDPGVLHWDCFAARQKQTRPIEEPVEEVEQTRRLSVSVGSCIRHNRRGCLCAEGKG